MVKGSSRTYTHPYTEHPKPTFPHTPKPLDSQGFFAFFRPVFPSIRDPYTHPYTHPYIPAPDPYTIGARKI